MTNGAGGWATFQPGREFGDLLVLEGTVDSQFRRKSAINVSMEIAMKNGEKGIGERCKP